MIASVLLAAAIALGPEEPIASAHIAAASSDGDSTVVAWAESDAIVAMRWNSRERIVISNKTGHDLSTISLRGRHYVAWRTDTQLLLAEVGRERVVVAQAQMPFVDSPASKPALATNGRDILLVWNDMRTVRAAHVSLDGRVGRSILIAKDEANVFYSPTARWNGRDYEVTWMEQPPPTHHDVPPKTYDIHRVRVRGRRVTVEPAIATKAFYPLKMVFADGRPIFPEYAVPFFGFGPRPDTVPPATLLLRTARDGKSTTLFEHDYTQGQPALDLAIVPRDDGYLLFWTEVDSIHALRLDRDLRASGHALIGEASEGTLQVVATKNATILIYSRADQLFTRTLMPE